MSGSEISTLDAPSAVVLVPLLLLAPFASVIVLAVVLNWGR